MAIRFTTKPNTRIADIGSGKDGGVVDTWKGMMPKGCAIDAYDLNIEPKSFVQHGTSCNFYRTNVEFLYYRDDLESQYDVVIADDIFEHVENAHMFSMTLNHIVKKGGLVHVAIPSASNFTDIIYRLIHSGDGGTHFQRFVRDSFVELFSSYGFLLEEEEVLPDNWLWLERAYDVKALGFRHSTPEEIKYLARTFRAELTLEKGYYYGYEFLFRKIEEVKKIPVSTAIPVEMNVSFGDHVTLESVTPITGRCRPGEYIEFDVAWSFKQKMKEGVLMSYYIGNESSPNVVFKDISRFFRDRRRFDEIEPGDKVRDSLKIYVRPDVSPGRYTLSALLYPRDGYVLSEKHGSKILAGSKDLMGVEII